MSKSTWDDPRITAYVLGELPPDEKTAFESDCSSDPALAAAVDEARSVTDQLQHWYADESTPPLDPERRSAIVGGGENSVSLPESKSSWPIVSLVLAAAAVLLLLVGLAPWLRQQDATVAMDDQTQTRPAAAEQAGAESQAPPEELEERSSLMKRGRKAADPESDLAARVSGAKAADESVEAMVAKPAPRADSSAPTEAPVESSGPAESSVGLASKSAAPLTQPAQPDPAPTSAPVPMADSFRYKSKAEAESAPLEPMDVDAENATSDGASLPALGKQEKQRLSRAVEDLQEQVRLQISDQKADQSRPMPQPGGASEQKRRSLALSVQNRASAAKQPATKDLARVDRSLRDTRPSLPIDAKGNDYGAAIDEGRGPGISGDQFEPITDNPFKRVSEEALSTFSVDVDTASYSKTRDFLMRANQLPRPDAVRIEELINYFQYDYKAPEAEAEHPFATHVEITECPWNDDHKIARIGLQGKTMRSDERPPCNLVFLLDTSGSMNAPNKLPLVVEGMKMLIDQLTGKDKVAITVYAGSAGLVLDSTSAKKSKEIRKALTRLSAGGSTNGGAGIALAYQTARSNFIPDGVNRVILCTDGDFNVGVTGTDSLVRMVEEEAKGGIFLSVLGFGMGNHNDAMLEKISGRGNGNYSFIDTRNEAHKVLVDQTNGTLVTIAKDVKLQIEFNVNQVSQYRLIGYENRVLAKEDFNDDTKDAGEIGAGHSVTALYEIVPAGKEADASQPKVDQLKYQSEPRPTEAAESNELMTLKLRYKQPDGDTSTLVEIPVENECVAFDKASDDVRFAAAVAGFGMQLRRSPYAGNWTLSDVEQVAKSATGEDDYRLRHEFVELVRKASQLMGQQ